MKYLNTTSIFIFLICLGCVSQPYKIAVKNYASHQVEYARALKEDRIVLMDTEVSKGTRAIEVPMSQPLTWQNPQQPAGAKKVSEDKT